MLGFHRSRARPVEEPVIGPTSVPFPDWLSLFDEKQFVVGKGGGVETSLCVNNSLPSHFHTFVRSDLEKRGDSNGMDCFI